MSTIIITLVDGTEYYLNRSSQVTAVTDGLTGKKTVYSPDSKWTIKGVWFNKLFGKGFTAFDEFLSQFALGKIHFSDKKGLCKYGVCQSKDGKEENIGPLSDRGITFIKIM